jgi:hypothetical protein
MRPHNLQVFRLASYFTNMSRANLPLFAISGKQSLLVANVDGSGTATAAQRSPNEADPRKVAPDHLPALCSTATSRTTMRLTDSWFAITLVTTRPWQDIAYRRFRLGRRRPPPVADRPDLPALRP